ncbi:MAG TPA: plastocyanin/azurin family copper-binding protein [Dongiaceae bacterium]|nr:plastocyanin/azurin family copper-binding protein [Dongiaceae bacterium]
MKTYSLILLAVVLNAGIAQAETIEVGQKDKAFTTDKVEIKVGDTIKFTNNDPFFHNVFSLSDAKMFDLGSYPQGESKEVVFDQPGEVDVECAIHPNMQLKVIVK